MQSNYLRFCPHINLKNNAHTHKMKGYHDCPLKTLQASLSHACSHFKIFGPMPLNVFLVGWGSSPYGFNMTFT